MLREGRRRASLAAGQWRQFDIQLDAMLAHEEDRCVFQRVARFQVTSLNSRMQELVDIVETERGGD
jgi:hypothetical protein